MGNCADFGLACRIGGCKARWAGPRFHSGAEPWYTPIKSETQAVAGTQKQTKPFTEVDKLAVATDHKPLISRLEKGSLDKWHNVHLFRIQQITGMWK